MENDLISYSNRRLPQKKFQMEDDIIFFQMEDNIIFFKIEIMVVAPLRVS